MGLKFLDFGAVWVECVEVGKHDVPFDATRITRPQVPRIGEHGANFRADLIWRGGEAYGIPQRLAGLTAVHTRKTRRVRQERSAFGQQGPPSQVSEAPYDFVGLLDHWELVTSHRDERGTDSSDVGCLTDGVYEEPGGDTSPKAAERNLLTNRGVPLEACDRHQVEVEYGELRELRDAGLHGNGARGGIDADGEIVEREFHDLLANVDRTAGVIGECLEIGNEDGLIVLVLECQAGLERTGEVPEVQRAGRTIPREYHLTVRGGDSRRGVRPWGSSRDW
jgi:hypothetical protein